MATTTKAASTSQTYMVSIQTITDDHQITSAVEGYENYGPLYKSSFYFEKIVSPEAGADLFSSATITTSPLSVTIQKGRYIADLQVTFLKGSPIEQIEIITLANVGGTNQIVDKLIFNNSYILSLDSDQTLTDGTEVVLLGIRYTKYTHTVWNYDQEGTLLGKNESTFDLTKNTTSTTGVS